MPQGPVRNPLMKPFVVLALPGMYLFYKYNQYKRRRKENAKRRLTERELQHLNNKIDKLLSQIEESEPELAATQEEECVICINAKATMTTVPCGHKVVCRKCFVKTIQIAVSQRLLPLRCVICRAKILRLRTGPALPISVSGYSVRSRASSSSSSVPPSDSLYSVSSGGSSISSTSCSSISGVARPPCCASGACLGGAYPRRRPMAKIHHHLADHCHPDIKRLPPIRELPSGASPSPSHATPTPTPPAPQPASTRIRCTQKIVTQLEEAVPLLGGGAKYERIIGDEEEQQKKRCWWPDRKKNDERLDNKKNEIVEKNMEMKGLQGKLDMKKVTVKEDCF